jgi:hypothetical protein
MEPDQATTDRTADAPKWLWIFWLIIPGLGVWCAWNGARRSREEKIIFFALMPLTFAWTTWLVQHGMGLGHARTSQAPFLPHSPRCLRLDIC